MYGVSVCTTCMSVHSSHRRHALSFLFIDLGLKILKPENRSQSQFCLCTDPSIKSQSQLNNSVLCWLFMLVVRVVQTATSKQRTKVLCALLVYLKDTANGREWVWYVSTECTTAHSRNEILSNCSSKYVHSSLHATCNEQ